MYLLSFSDIQILLTILYFYLLNLATVAWKLFGKSNSCVGKPLKCVVEAKTSFLFGCLLVLGDISIRTSGILKWIPKDLLDNSTIHSSGVSNSAI